MPLTSWSDLAFVVLFFLFCSVGDCLKRIRSLVYFHFSYAISSGAHRVVALFLLCCLL